jgi:hypothetical protein
VFIFIWDALKFLVILVLSVFIVLAFPIGIFNVLVFTGLSIVAGDIL